MVFTFSEKEKKNLSMYRHCVLAASESELVVMIYKTI